MATIDLGFIHRYVPAPGGAAAPTLLLLHGTGGNENDLLNLGRTLVPDAGLLSPRGKVLEHGMPRYFRRLAEGVFDLEDLTLRTHELAAFVGDAAAHYGFDPGAIVAVGYSNGANIAASTLLLHPRLLSAAVLFRPMVPLEPQVRPDLGGVSVFAAAGTFDPLVQPQETERLVTLLRGAGAQVALHWQEGGHALGGEEITAARQWLSAWIATRKVQA